MTRRSDTSLVLILTLTSAQLVLAFKLPLPNSESKIFDRFAAFHIS